MNFHDTQLGSIRSRCGFLVWPKRIGAEVRWMEFARWQEEFKLVLTDAGSPVWCYFSGPWWSATKWLENSRKVCV